MINSNFKSIKAYFTLYLFIINTFCVNKIITEDTSLIQITSYSYPQSITLKNGNILVSSTNGFYFYNSLMTKLIKSYPYNDNLVLSDTSIIKNTFLFQFSEDDNIIICFVSNTIYIFSADGQSLLNNISLSLTASYFSMTPFKTDNNSYYFFLCYQNDDDYLELIYYSINKTIYSLTKKYTFLYKEKIIYLNSFSCHKMYSESEGLVLTCFISTYDISDNIYYKVIVCVFKINDVEESSESEEEISQINDFVYVDNNGLSNYFKSATNKDLSKAICCFSNTASPGYCYFYDINNNKLTGGDKYFTDCGFGYLGLKIEYFSQTNEFVASCKNALCNFKIVKFNDNFDEIEIKNGDTTTNDWSINDCSSAYTYNVIYEINSGKYYMLTYNFDNLSGWATRYYNLPDYFSGVVNNSTINDNINEEEKEENEKKEESEEKEEENILNNEEKEKELNNEEEKELNIENEEKLNNEEKENNILNNEEENNEEKENESSSLCPINQFYSKELQICIFFQKHYIKNGTLIYLTNNEYCPNYIPYENSTTKECIYKCEASSFISNECFLDNPSEDSISKTNDIVISILNNTKFDDSVNIIIGEEYVIYQIVSDENNYKSISNNFSTIDLGECGNILKKIYNITSILILKIDIKTSNANSKAVKFELYHPETKQKLDLSYCSDEKINIYSPAILSQDTMNMFEFASSQSYNVFDSEDKFYNDLCTKFTSENGTDVLISDRKNNYYNENIILCEDNCNYKNYNIVINKIQCECEIDQNTDQLSGKTNFVSQNLNTDFFSKNYFSNLKVIKCYKLFFNISEQIKNIGTYVLFISIIFFIIVMALFYYKQKIKIFRLIDNLYANKRYGINIISNPIKYKNSENFGNKKGNNIIINNLIFSENVNNQNKNINEVEETNFKKVKPIKIKSKKVNPSMKVNKKDQQKKKPDNNFIFVNNTKIISDLTNKKLLNLHKIRKKNIISPIHKENNLPIKRSMKTLYIDEEMNGLSFNEALKFDKRNFRQYYWSLLKTKHLIILTFFAKNDYNLLTLKIGFLIISFCLYFVVNACFFTDSTMHNIYEVSGTWKIIAHLPIMIYSNIISAVIKTLMKFLALSSKNILALKKTDSRNILKKGYELNKCLHIKFNVFFWLSFLLLLLFWYFIETFCAVYVNTQKILIKDTLSSFILSLIYPFGLNLLPAFFRIKALKNRKEGNKCMFNISKILALI